MPAILVTLTEEDQRNSENSNVMVFSETVTAAQLAARLREVNHPFEDCYEVPEDQHQYYLYEPLWLSPKQEQRLSS